MKPASYAPIYALGVYPKLAEFFRNRGYALAVHGSFTRDMDLIAVPWVDEAWHPDDVIAGVVKKFAIARIPDDARGTKKPHGRVAYRLFFSFADLSLDISFTPRRRLR